MKSEVMTVDKPTVAGKLLTTKLIMVAGYSFFICRCSILQAISPFGVSFAAALPIQYGWIAFLGGFLGYGVQGLGVENAIYLIALSFCLVFKLVFRRHKAFAQPMAMAIIVTILVFTAELIGGYLQDSSGVGYLIRLCESIFAGGVTYFTAVMSGALFRAEKMTSWTRAELGSLTILLMLLVIALMDSNLGVFSFGIIAAGLLIQIVLHRMGATLGITTAILCAIAINLYQVDYLPLAAMLVVSTLITGIFARFGRLLQVAMFLLCAIFSLFVLGTSATLLYQLLNLLVSCGLFLVLRTDQLQWVPALGQQKTGDGLQDNVQARLKFAAYTVSDLQSTLQQLANLQEKSNTDIIDVYQQTVTATCLHCSGNKRCWQQHHAQTAEVFLHLTEQLKQGVAITADALAEFKLFHCHQEERLCERLSAYYADFTAQEQVRQQAEKLRQMAMVHLTGMAETFFEVSDEIATLTPTNPKTCDTIRRIFTELADTPTGVFCTMGQADRVEITLYTTAAVQYDADQLCARFSHALNRSFAKPVRTQAGNQVRLSFFESANFDLQTGICQLAGKHNCNPSDVCGDTCSTFYDNKGNAYFLLSDGMGSGKAAAVDSAMTCSVILKLIRAGFSLDTVVQFINSMLQVHRCDETLATVDLAKLDLYTAHTLFYKAGSAPSFVYTNGVVMQITSDSLPVGILQQVTAQKRTVSLHAGDILVMLSDGVLGLSKDTLRHEIAQSTHLSAQQIANHLCRLAQQANPQHDDLTVLVTKIEEIV